MCFFTKIEIGIFNPKTNYWSKRSTTEEDSLDHIQNRILWILAGTQTLIYFSFRWFGKHRRVRERKINCLFFSSPTLDCDQSLFFFRFSKGSARTRECWAALAARCEKGGPLPSCAFSHARGHLRVLGVLLDGPRKMGDCLESTPTPTPLCWQSINPPQFIFYHGCSTYFEEKIEGLWIGYLDTWSEAFLYYGSKKSEYCQR